MKTLKNLLTSFALLLSFAAISSAQQTIEKPSESQRGMKEKLPSSAEIFRKNAHAKGGIAAAEKIKTRVSKGTVEIAAMGLKGALESSAKSPGKILTVLNLNGLGEILDGFDGSEGWAKDPIQGLQTKRGEELAQMRLHSDFYYDFNLEKHYPKSEITGSEKFGAYEVYVVKADPNTTMYFDKQSGQMIRLDRLFTTSAGKFMTQNFFDDFREVDGLKHPFVIRQVANGIELSFKLTEIKQNVEINDSIFSRPK